MNFKGFENELHQFPNQSFDYVVLSQTLQAFYNPEKVLRELLRIGKSVIISIPNFGYWRVRTSLLFFGKMPITKTLPNSWYNTCLLYTSPSPRDRQKSRMPSSA